MRVKQYGVFLAYQPKVDLRHEGLGRYLAAFLKGAAGRDDVRFTLVCPSWSEEGLRQLLHSEGVPDQRFQIVCPTGKPLVLRVYESYVRHRSRLRRPGMIRGGLTWLKAVREEWIDRVARRLAQAYNIGQLLPILLEVAAVACLMLLATPLLVLAAIGGLVVSWTSRLVAGWLGMFGHMRTRLDALISRPQGDPLALRLYQYMEDAETERMLGLIDGMAAVRAWYCPTAYWPAFNRIRAPRLLCVPDVVLSEFPAGFSLLGGDPLLKVFETVEETIYGARHFVTYSDEIKWRTLVQRYAVPPENIMPIRHAPSDLARWVSLDDAISTEAHETRYCLSLLNSALAKSTGQDTFVTAGGQFRFVFYASQFRPNKNVLTLLRAYRYLLRSRFVGHKLVLTGSRKMSRIVDEFIREQSLDNDVLCLHGLSVQELAACYKLADLAVNPSLSEGGCPFTFTEALSVGTPVVMGRIPVAEEVLTDPELQGATFFDPHDWRDMANRIEWALANRTHLLDIQRKTYRELAARTWTDVVNEHIEALEKVATSREPDAAQVSS